MEDYGDDFAGRLVFFDRRQLAFARDTFPDQVGKEGLQHGEPVCDGDIAVASMLQIADELQDALFIGELEIGLRDKLEEDAQGEAVAVLRGWRVVSFSSSPGSPKRRWRKRYQLSPGVPGS